MKPAAVAALLTVFAAAPLAVADAPPAGKADPALIARAEELWKRRDDRAANAEMKRLIDRGLAQAPNDYDILWRAAAWHFWHSDDPERSLEDRARFGKAGWDLAERAIKANPNGIEGYFFAAVAMGNYSIGIGILRALGQRIEGKYTGRLGEAERRRADFANGAIQVSWGRYHAQLPWPKYDDEKAIARFKQAIAINPNNLRARAWLAEVLLAEGQPQEAKKLLDEVLAAPVGKYDAPEERRAKLIAGQLRPKVEEKLK